MIDSVNFQIKIINKIYIIPIKANPKLANNICKLIMHDVIDMKYLNKWSV